MSDQGTFQDITKQLSVLTMKDQGSTIPQKQDLFNDQVNGYYQRFINNHMELGMKDEYINGDVDHGMKDVHSILDNPYYSLLKDSPKFCLFLQSQGTYFSTDD